jgi:hypothetical protein
MKCIYKIRNKTDNKFYLGSSKNKTNRWREHKRDLRNNKHHCVRLQNAWNKYGADNFVFEVVEEFPEISDELLLRREQYWLEKLNPCDDSIGYNISPNAHGGWRGKLSKCTRRVKQYDLQGNLVKEWESAGAIKRELGLVVYDCLYRRQRSNFGYIWCFADEEPVFYNKYHDDCLRKPVLQFTKKGEFVMRWNSITEAMDTLDIWGIEAAANGYKGRKSAHGFIWIFEGQEDRLAQCMAKRTRHR